MASLNARSRPVLRLSSGNGAVAMAVIHSILFQTRPAIISARLVVVALTSSIRRCNFMS
ncbi:hypothetical protein D3C78_1644480 [compost metagenome]